MSGAAANRAPQEAISEEAIFQDVMLQEAMGHFAAGRVPQADVLCGKILTANREHVAALHLAAVIAFVTDRTVEGVALLNRVFNLDPHNAQAFATLGDALAVKGEREGAVAAFQRGVALRPDDAGLHVKLGVTLCDLGRFDDAEAAYRRAIALAPNLLRAHFNLAIALKALDRRSEAVEVYRDILARDPSARDALLNLGNVLLDLGKSGEAVDAYQRVVTLQPDFAAGFRNLALALCRQRRPGEAMTACLRAISLQPGDVDGHVILAQVLLDLDRLADAAAAYRHALTLSPDDPELHRSLGDVLYRQGQFAEAVDQGRRATALAPDNVAALKFTALVLHESGRRDEALDVYRRICALKPDDAVILSNFGACLYELGELTDATEACQLALAVDPARAPAHTTLGAIFEAQEDYQAAVGAHRRAIAADPAYARGHGNLAIALRNLGRIDEAIAASRRAIALDPDDLLSRFNHAHFLLMTGDFIAGFREYDWCGRHKAWSDAGPSFDAPHWEGEALAGRTLLLHAEYGLGDALQFVRYIPAVAAMDGPVVLQVQPEIAHLLRAALDIPVIARGEPLPPFDLQLPLMSLARVFGTTLETIPANIPYLRPDPAKLAHWQRRLDGVQALKVGVVWAGNPRHKGDRQRSLSAATVLPRLLAPGVQLFSLQKDPRPADGLVLAGLGGGIVDLAPMLGDFSDTAAAVSALDLVISADTSVAHLAGALGRPVWMMLPYSLDWRWLTQREDSPWYPTMRLFRQREPHEWDTVLSRLPTELARVVAGERALLLPPVA